MLYLTVASALGAFLASPELSAVPTVGGRSSNVAMSTVVRNPTFAKLQVRCRF